jgi:hypothetical protein
MGILAELMPGKDVVIHVIVICHTLTQANIFNKAPGTDPFQIAGKMPPNLLKNFVVLPDLVPFTSQVLISLPLLIGTLACVSIVKYLIGTELSLSSYRINTEYGYRGKMAIFTQVMKYPISYVKYPERVSAGTNKFRCRGSLRDFRKFPAGYHHCMYNPLCEYNRPGNPVTSAHPLRNGTRTGVSDHQVQGHNIQQIIQCQDNRNG